MEDNPDTLKLRIDELEQQVRDLRMAVLQSTLLTFQVGTMSVMPQADDKDKKFQEVKDMLAEIFSLIGIDPSEHLK